MWQGLDKEGEERRDQGLGGGVLEPGNDLPMPLLPAPKLERGSGLAASLLPGLSL